jgi:hypothetical protein
MKSRKSIILASTGLLLMTLSSCELIGGIFKGGMYFGIALVVIVIALVIWLVSRIGKR